MSTSDDKIRREEVDEEELAKEVEAAKEKSSEETSGASEEELKYAEDEAGEEHREDGPYEEEDPNAGKGDETTQPDDSKPEVEETSKDKEAPAEEAVKDVADEGPINTTPDETEEDLLEQKAAQESVMLEKEANQDPVPNEGEEKDTFINRYMNSPRILRRISPPYRRAAAEAVWKQVKIDTQ